jgi:5-bromo-4-chloroindolyl phosphate hydrolysis protein
MEFRSFPYIKENLEKIRSKLSPLRKLFVRLSYGRVKKAAGFAVSIAVTVM